MQNRITLLFTTTAIVFIFLALFSPGSGVRGEETAILPYCLEVNGIAPDVYREAGDAVAIGELAAGARIYPTAKSGDCYAFTLADGSNAYIEAKGVEASTGVAFIAAAEATLYRADDGAPLKTLAAGDAVTLTGRRGDQYQVSLDDGVQGFVNQSDLNTAEENGAVLAAEEIVEIAAYAEKQAKTNSGTGAKVNVRIGPGTSHTAMTSLADGAVVTIIGETNGWYQVRLADNRTGYIRCDLLQIIDEQTPVSGDLKGATVVVDPGHGAHDPGALGPTVQEKTINLAIGLLLRDALQGCGATVIMTRDSDVYLTLQERAAVANDAKADYFISVHCNSSGSGTVSGTSTWYSTFGSDAYLNQDRKALATEIQKQLAANLGIPNYGLRIGDFTVINRTTMPSALIETAFIDHPGDEALLKTAAFQQKTANAICAGLVSYAVNAYQGFADVRTHWARESIEFVVGEELFNGTTARKFGPNLTMTRGMLVTVLHRMAGEPAAQGDGAFTDLAANAYYLKAVAWANEQGIVTGVGGGRFAPNANITRQELVTMFNRYAAANQLTLPQKLTDSYQKYSDCAEVQTWAASAMEWAYQGELVNGRTATTLAPCGTATRAEVAVICKRFLESATP